MKGTTGERRGNIFERPAEPGQSLQVRGLFPGFQEQGFLPGARQDQVNFEVFTAMQAREQTQRIDRSAGAGDTDNESQRASPRNRCCSDSGTTVREFC